MKLVNLLTCLAVLFIILSPTTSAQITLDSGNYTPIVTDFINLDGIDATPCQWLRVGSVVTVSCKFVNADSIVSSYESGFSLDLPVVTDFTTVNQCAGAGAFVVVNANGLGISTYPVEVIADPNTNFCAAHWIANNVNLHSLSITFTYTVQ